MLFAILSFALLVIALLFTGLYFGFWEAMTPHLIDCTYAACLMPDFATGLITEAISFVSQVILVAGIFGFISNSRNRRNTKLAHQKLAESIIGVLAKSLNTTAKASGSLPGKSSKYRTDIQFDVTRFQWRYDSAIDLLQERLIDELYQRYATFYFESNEEGYDVTKLGNSLLKETKRLFKSLNLSKAVRKERGRDLMTAMKSFLVRLPLSLDEASIVKNSWDKNSF